MSSVLLSFFIVFRGPFPITFSFLINQSVFNVFFKDFFIKQKTEKDLDIETIVKSLYQYAKYYVYIALLKEKDEKLLKVFSTN